MALSGSEMCPRSLIHRHAELTLDSPPPRDFLCETKLRRPRTFCDRRARKMWEVAMRAWIGLAVISLSPLWSTRGWSADLRVMSGGAPQELLAALKPEFENRTGHKAIFSFAVITTLEQRLASGERTDVVLMPVPAIDKLVHAGSLSSREPGDPWRARDQRHRAPRRSQAGYLNT